MVHDPALTDTRRVELENGDWRDERIANIANTFAGFGVTLTQAKVYLFLLSHPNSIIRNIVGGTGLHRVDVYRKIHELERLGLLVTYLNIPKQYSVVKPEVAIATLIQAKKEKLRYLKERSTGLVEDIKALTNAITSDHSEIQFHNNFSGRYRLISERRRYYSEMKEVIRKSQREILRIVSPGGVIRCAPAGLSKEFATARARGVKIRMITELIPINKIQAKELSTIVDLRIIRGIHMRFTIVDQTLAIISANTDDLSKRLSSPDVFLVLEDTKLALALSSIFEELWKIASKIKSD